MRFRMPLSSGFAGLVLRSLAVLSLSLALNPVSTPAAGGGGAAEEGGRPIAQIIRPTLPVISLPTPEPPIIVPTGIIVVPIGTPTPTPTPIPPLDLGFHSNFLTTERIVHSIADAQSIRGEYEIFALNAPVDELPVSVSYQLIDSASTIVKSWSEEKTLTGGPGVKTYINAFDYDFPIVPGDALPLDEYKMRITVLLREDELAELPPGTPAPDPTKANNISDTVPRKIVHLSGNLAFNDIQTTITDLTSSDFSPLTLDGGAEWNGTGAAITFTGLEAARDPVSLDCEVTDGTASFAPPSNPYRPAGSDWEYQYFNGELNKDGGFANMIVGLPDTVMYTIANAPTIAYLDRLFALGNQRLTQTMQLASASVNSTLDLEFASETLAFVVTTTGQRFDYTRGLILENPQARYRFADHFNAGYGPGKRASNDGNFQGALAFSGDVVIGPGGLDAQLDADPLNYQTSFPYKADLALQAANYEIGDSRVRTAGSSAAGGDVKMTVETSSCASLKVARTASFNTAAEFARDGAVVLDGPISTAWNPDFNTYDLQPASSAAWYQPGWILPPNGMKNGTDVAEYLQAMRDRDQHALRSYGNAAFTNGTGLFAGLNLMPEEFDGRPFKAAIDGNQLDFTHTEWSKLYVRPGGYSGVVDAESAGQSFSIYSDPECGGQGYGITLTSFGQAYLDNGSEGLSSTIDGEIDIPWPSSIVIPFEDMTLNGCGNFTGGDVPADAKKETKTLAYWQADLRVLTFAFELREGAVNDNERTLWISSKNTIANLQHEPTMQTNIRPCGSIRDSRIESPLASAYDGYNTTVQKIYLSKWDGNPSSPNGFYSLVGDLVVSFFNPPKVHILVRGLTGEIVSGDPWFGGPDPDGDQDGFPSGFGASNTQIDQKIGEYVDEAPVAVNTKFANIIDLEYTVLYNKAKKEFASDSPIGHDLIVIDIESAVEYLNASKTEVSFGVEVSGIPELNLSSAASQFSDEIQDTFLGPVRDRLDEVSDALTGDLTTIIRPLVEDAIRPHVQALLNDLQEQLQAVDPANYSALINGVSFQNELDGLLAAIDFDTYLRNSNIMPVVDVLDDIVSTIRDVTEVLQFNPADLAGELGPVVQTLMDLALSIVQAQTGYDLNELLAPVQAVVNDINDFLDEEVIPRLEDAEAFFDDPLSYLDQFFPFAEIANLESQIKSQLTSALNQAALQNSAMLPYVSADQLTDHIVDALFNSSMMQELNTFVTTELFPVKDALLDQAQFVLDAVNDTVQDFIKENLGEFLDGAFSEIKDTVGFEGASMKGYAIISGNKMEKLHIDAEFSMSVPDEVTYAAYLDMTRYQISNSGKTCFANLDAEDVIDARIGAKDIALGWAGAGLTAEIIELKLMISGGVLVNVGGTLQTTGELGFESFAIIDPSFGVAVGAVENYFWASIAVKFESYTLKGGIFLGTSCTLEPLEIIDPEVASVLSVTEMRGIYLGVGGSFPILNFGCFLKVGVSAEVAFWYFANGPTFGGKLVAGAYGEAACIVSVKGQLSLIGGKDAGKMFFKGNAWVGGGIGFCEPEDWNSPQDVLDDGWCASCVATIDLIYKNDDWDADYDVDCSL